MRASALSGPAQEEIRLALCVGQTSDLWSTNPVAGTRRIKRAGGGNTALKGVGPNTRNRGRQAGPPRTDDRRLIRRIAREAGEVIGSDGFRYWYNATRCDGAPSFPRYWAYVRKSLGYDVPGRELCGPIWEATARAFETFDATRGVSETPVESRFLKHWRAQLANSARSCFKQYPKAGPLPEDLAGPAYDPFHELMKRGVLALVASLPADEEVIVRQRYWYGTSFRELALQLRQRKATVIGRHEAIIGKLKSLLEQGVAA